MSQKEFQKQLQIYNKKRAQLFDKKIPLTTQGDLFNYPGIREGHWTIIKKDFSQIINQISDSENKKRLTSNEELALQVLLANDPKNVYTINSLGNAKETIQNQKFYSTLSYQVCGT